MSQPISKTMFKGMLAIGDYNVMCMNYTCGIAAMTDISDDEIPELEDMDLVEDFEPNIEWAEYLRKFQALNKLQHKNPTK